MNSYTNPYVIAADAAPDARGRFLRNTYLHLAGAILAFAGLEAALIQSSFAPALMQWMMGGKYSWLIVLGAFMAVSWIADKWARSDANKTMQYLGLGLFVVAEAVIFLPMVYYAWKTMPDTILMAAILTLGLSMGLTGVVVFTRIDFSFLRGVLVIGGFIALGAIVASILFGFQLGILFSAVMVAFAAAAVLYNTSAIFRSYRTDQYVAAALSLFASIALLFWYILRILMSLRR